VVRHLRRGAALQARALRPRIHQATRARLSGEAAKAFEIAIRAFEKLGSILAVS
jgi:hypothetical protein